MEETAKTFGRMITKTKPLKIWSAKGTEFKRAFEKICESKGNDTFTTNSETKSAFAERNIRSLQNHLQTFGRQMVLSPHKRISNLTQ